MKVSYKRVQEVFLAAKEREATRRPFDIEAACAGDRELITTVEALLAASREDTGFLNTPVMGREFSLAFAPSWEPGALVGEDLGRYRILRLISEGGMSVVYLARQDEPEREVALKFLRPGCATPAMLRRLEDETRILARFQHPGIAQIYDAGVVQTDAGPQSFFAMEYVRGRTLTEHAAERDLPTRERIELLAVLCDTVQFAHQNAVIHRDLKPANVLVTEDGLPKIIDFGIARTVDGAVRGSDVRTSAGQLVGTVPYMSPEQIDGRPGDVDARSDLYALGVLGYELLTGRMPYELEGKGFAEVARIVCHRTPTLVGSIDPALRGDVEAILAKALEKEKGLRYPSAGELAADLRRYLRNEPVTARPPSLWYELGKFARRHRATCTAGALALLLLLAGVVSTVLGWSEARAQTLSAEVARADSEAVTSFLESAWTAVDPTELGREVLARDVLDAAVASLDRELAGRPRIEARARYVLGNAFDRLGEYAAADHHLSVAFAILDRELGAEHERTRASRRALALVRQKNGDLEGSLALYREALEVERRVGGADDPKTLATQAGLGDVCRTLGRFDEAGRLLTEAHAGLTRALGEDHERSLEALVSLAHLRRAESRYAEAEELYEAVRRGWTRARGADSLDTLAAAGNVAVIYRELGRWEEAEGLYREVLDGRLRAYGERHPRTLTTMNNLGRLLHERWRMVEAEEILTRTLELRREELGPEHPETLISLSSLGGLFLHTGRLAEAQALFEEALEVRVERYGEEDLDALVLMENLAKAHQDQGHMDEAERLFARVLAMRERTLGDDHAHTARARNSLGAFYLKVDRPADAEPLLARAAADAPGHWPADDSKVAVILLNYGEALRQLGKLDEAKPPLLQALEVFTETYGSDHAYAEVARRCLDSIQGERLGAQDPSASHRAGPDAEPQRGE